MAITLQRALRNLGKAVAPVFFEKERKGKFTFRDPVGPGIADAARVMNQATLQFENGIIPELQKILAAVVLAGDSVTDIISTLPRGDQDKALTQAQELLDIPLTGILQAMIMALAVVQSSNTITINKIRAARKRRKK